MSSMLTRIWTTALPAVLLFGGTACGKDAKLPTVTVDNVAELRQRIGEEVIVTGTVSSTGQSSSGHQFLNFNANRGFAVVVRSEDVKKFTDGKPSVIFKGKAVAMSGKLERFKDKVQLRLSSPSQIEVLKPTDPKVVGKDKLPAAVKLTPLGNDGWMSPAGLKYVGRDGEGLSRKAHVLRHARDIPDRDGPHGVFDGGEELAFAWVDAAWQQIQQKKLKPRNEGDRQTYTVSMGRRVGYLGGSVGNRKGKPPLTKIFLVIRTNTKEVVTAFPR